jgi:AraC-like DNA-binding protein
VPPIVDHTIKTRLLLRPARSGLGTIRLGGVNQGGFGVGRPPEPRRQLPCYGMVYILGGSGVYADANTPPTPVEKGDLVIFFPGRPHQCGTLADAFWDELWFEFEGPAFDIMRRTGLLDTQRPVHRTQNHDHWFRRFFQITPPVYLREKTPSQVVVSRFISVLTEILADSESGDDPPGSGPEWLNAACELLGTHDNGPGLQPAAVARKLGFSYETFRKKFRQDIGFSPGQFHLDSRIDRAAALLHQGLHTVKEIAAQLEFCDQFYFSRCFKRRFGQSPRAFQQRVRGG